MQYLYTEKMNKFKIIQLIYKINNKFMMEAMVN